MTSLPFSRSVSSVLAMLLALSGLVAAQDYRGKVQGTVTDPDGNAVVGARVILHNDETGVDATRQSDTEGHYIFDFVDPGIYTVNVEQTGFKKAEQKNVVVRNRGDVTVDLKMTVGGVEEVITVAAPPVAVEFNSSSTALTIENKIVDQLPIRGRNPYNLTTLDPTINGGENAENRPYHHAYGNEFDAGGQTTRANDIQLDGVPMTSSYKSSYTPSIDAVKEVTFQKNAIDSEYGYSSGGIIIVNMKSGTNDFHGSAYSYWRSPSLNAFADPTIARTANADETRFRGTNLKIYGGSVGGPVVKNKLFFFTSYEKWTDARPITVVLTLPTALERQGNFSQSVRGGVVRTIFDPFTSTGTNGVRTAFAGNLIPSQRIDPTAQKLLNELPMPNLPGNDQNWQGLKTENVDYWNLSSRVDWNYSEKWKTFFRYGQYRTHLLEANPTDKKLFPLTGSNRYGFNIAADSVITLSSTMLLNLRANFHKLTDEAAVPTVLLGADGLQQLWPGNPFYASLYTIDQIYYPALDVGTGNRLGRTGREFWQHPQGWAWTARMNKYAGSHSMKWGGEMRVDRGKGARFEPLNFFFRANLTANQASNSNLTTSGSEWASFLLGALEPNGTSTSSNNFARRVPVQEVISFGYAGYFMDDYKVNQRLTLNLGLRWEYEPGPIDAQNRLSQRIDLSNPIPEFQSTPPSSAGLTQAKTLLATKGYQHIYNGAWVFVDANDRHVWDRDVLNLMPRLGGAFRINDISALRFGYARYMEPSSRIRDPLGDFVDQYTGYATTTFVAPLISGRPQALLSNPYPATNPVQQPTNQSLARYTNLGNTINLDQFDQQPQINDRFTLSYQREIFTRTVVDFTYFYNYGTNLPYTIDLNMVDPAFRYEQPRATLSANVPNPFFNYLTPDKFPGALRNQSTVQFGTLLRPYPQYGAINQTNTSGRKLKLHTFTIDAERSFSRGLSFLVAYAYNREQTTEFFDDRATFLRQFEWRNTASPRHRFTNALTWEIPVGRGRWLLNSAPRAVDLALGGWQFTTATRYYSGRTLFFNQSLIVDGNPRLDNPTRGTAGKWFDTTKFHQVPTPPTTSPETPRTNPWTFPGVLGPSIWQTDMTMSKSFRITERFRIEARVEGYNAFNHINWDNPGVDFNTPATFGKVTRKRTEYTGREIQYGLRLVF
ncbi:MAG TPA: carboxypeptidase-like regulatory domain-containing protein [Blastocatellia bacterium]|nr:carboxypeptidase-like regulatory domain-containing protein [Blastocatellia bacterium]